MKLSKYIKVLLSATVLALVSCGGSADCPPNGTPGSYNLVIDTTSPVPLVNGGQQPFYVYVTNVGEGNATNLSWDLNNPATDTAKSQGLWNKFKSLVGLDSKLEVVSAAISIESSGECLNINSGQTCRILMKATAESAIILQANSKGTNNKTIVTSSVSSYGYPIPSNVDPLGSGVLTLSPLSNINYGNGFSGMSFFIINNGTLPVSLDQAPVGQLPAGIDYKMLIGASCADPLPGGQSCQIRLTVGGGVNQPTGAVNLIPAGMVGSGESAIALPTQQAEQISVSGQKAGQIFVSTLSSLTLTKGSNPVSIGTISNTGSANLIIGNLSSLSGNVLSISGDNCSSKTLGVGDVCSYEVTANYDNTNASGTGSIKIPYNDGVTANSSTISNLAWTYVPYVASVPNISITSSGDLSNTQLVQTITLKNIGNVAFTNIQAPTVTPANPHIVVSGTCASPLVVNGSCTYTLTYTPVAPSETMAVTVGGISASYVDGYGKTQTYNATSTAVNVSSEFAGVLSADASSISLDRTTPSKTITITNTGNYKATLSNISVLGTNLTKAGTCNNGAVISARGGTCSVIVALANSITVGSGNGNLTVTYNNNNNDLNASVTSNISWLIGSVPSLKVTFDPATLFTPVNQTENDSVILENNGNIPLSAIVLPPLTAPFSWVMSTAASPCAIDGTQSLAIGESCIVTLSYTPTVAVSGTETIGQFSATTESGAYSSATPYVLSTVAATNNALTLPTGAVTQVATWAQNESTTTVTISNNGSRSVTLGTPTSTGVVTGVTGDCVGKVLAVGTSCTLSVIGTYTGAGTGSVIVDYTDNGNSFSQAFNVSGTYVAQPTITPGLTITRNPAGELIVANDGITKASLKLTLANTTTVSNQYQATDGTIKVLASSLLPVDSSGAVSYAVDSIVGSCIVDSDGYITISAGTTGNSCSYNIVATSTAPVQTSGTASASPSYNSESYGASSSIPSVQTNTLVGGYSVSTTVLTPLATLSTPTLVGSGFTTVEQGTPTQTVTFSIENVGAAAIVGSIGSTPSESGISVDTSACDNLAPGASCNVVVTMSTATAINGDLSAISLTVPSGNGAVLPSMPYQVTPVGAPAISITETVANCQSGTATVAIANPSVLPTCNINTGNAAPSIVLTFSNTGSGDAKSLSLTTTALSTAIAGNYTMSNSCGGTLAAGGTCAVTITPVIATTNNPSTTQYDISNSTGTGLVSVPYSYSYGSSNQLSSAAGLAANIGLDSTVATAILTVTSTDNPLSIKIGNTSNNLTVTASNWYSSIPSDPTFTFNPSDTGLTTTSCAFAGTSSCTMQISVESTVAIESYTLSATSGNISSTALSFLVISPWVNVGNPGFSGVVLSTYLSNLVFSPTDGMPYIAYSDSNGGPTVMKYNGSAWVNVGNPSFSVGVTGDISLAISPTDGMPYVVYDDIGLGAKAAVKKYNGSAWVAVGSASGISTGVVGGPNIAFTADGVPYVGFQNRVDDGTGHSTYTATVMKYSGSAWVNVGTPGLSAGVTASPYIAIAADGTPYVLYQESTYKTTVMKYNGSAWVTVGNAGFSPVKTFSPSIVISATGTPYVVYSDYNTGKLTVMKYDGSAWVTVGTPSFTAAASYPSLAFSTDGTPYVAYMDYANGAKTTVMEYNGSSWVNVGNAGFSAGTSGYPSLAFSPTDGMPYVAYVDVANSNKATVMKYAP